MLYIFLALSLISTAVLCGVQGWLSTWNALWQIPLTFAGFFVGLLVLFVLVLFISTRFIDRKKLLEKPSAYFRFMINQFCRLAFAVCGVRVHVTGLEKVPQGSRFLLVSNHLFAFDPLIYFYALPNSELGFISKKENFSMVMVAEVMRALLCLPIDRENDRSALKTILKAIQFLKEDKTSIAVFPEGHRSEDGELQEFRSGSFKIAQKAQVPIVVCVLANTPAILKNLFRKRTDVYLDVLDIIPAEDLEGVTTAQISSRVHDTMEKGIRKRKKKALA